MRATMFNALSFFITKQWSWAMHFVEKYMLLFINLL